KIQSDFCPRLFWYLERIVLHKKRPALWVRTGKELKMKKCFVLLRLFVDMLYILQTKYEDFVIISFLFCYFYRN
ncbi:hypothetical protein HMPREF1344_02105, partial [Enterococcus faecalis R508]